MKCFFEFNCCNTNGHILVNLDYSLPQEQFKNGWFREKTNHIFLDDKYHSYINRTYIKYEPLINFPGNVETSLSSTTVI